MKIVQEMNTVKLMFSALALFLAQAIEPAAQARPATKVRNIVIVHGAFADGSGWDAVYQVLTRDGYHVTIVQNPLVSLGADVAATSRALAQQDGPAVLVGHSYGGAVITQAGNDPKVKSLVYVAAFVPDAGESLQDLNAHPDPGFAPPPILPPADGFLRLDPAKFAKAFAADVDRDRAEFMAHAQAPLSVSAFAEKVTQAAWKTRPSFYIVTTEDRMIPLAAERQMASRARSVQVDVKASHAAYISQPEQVAKVIEKAAVW